MNDIERMIYNQMNEERFQRVISEKFSFVDSLIDQRDINKYKEAKENASYD